ncbi:GMC oxidoreductase [Streptosporangium carneum]|uniref:Glucose dehydrogenase n=1 Tax=Streptosporangium carneum TaxID=47481 RepID=A0A9W6I9Y7_9ACTN|nr:GMC oxidoreductase [Streptosporangium carneum]GLK13883.1 glucose dehydrogenase [Streptosporangium carneum]
MNTRWTSSADAVVVGFGLTGAPVLERLLGAHGANDVVVLDRGAFWEPADHSFPDERSLALDRPLTIAPEEDHVLLRVPGGERPLRKWWSARLAGGGSWLWYGQLSRFRSSDLRMRSSLGDAFGPELRDWPLDFAELENSYAHVQERLRPFGCAYGHTEPAYREFDGGPYRRRPGPSHFERVLVDGLQRDGLDAYVGQSCLGGRAWDSCPVSPVTGRPADRGRPMLARPNWYVGLYDRLRADPRVRLLGGSYVSRVLVEAGAVQGVEFVRRDEDGDLRTRRIRCRTVVLAPGALETARILLTSDLPNRNGLLGRGFTFTLERTGYLVTAEPRSRELTDRLAGLYGNVVVKDFYDLGDAGPLRKGGKFALYDAYVAETPARHVRNLKMFGAELAEFLRAESGRYVVKASFKGESLPSTGKFVSLSARRNSFGARVPVVTYTPHPADLLLQEQVTKIFARLGRALGATETRVHAVPAGADLVSAHHHGGAVFGENASDAVLDRDCECFEARGLFVADSSFMPTSGATNSSLTAMANAHRVAGVVAARLR